MYYRAVSQTIILVARKERVARTEKENNVRIISNSLERKRYVIIHSSI